MNVLFRKLNEGWNAEPNAPTESVELTGHDLLLRFRLNPWQFPQFNKNDFGILRFANCERFRLGPTNEEGWYRGQCRFSKVAPAWGDFYLLAGFSGLLESVSDWRFVEADSGQRKHFLFYFRDSTFECVAERCVVEPSTANALYGHGVSLFDF